MIPTIAQALGVTETGGLSAEEALEPFLRDRELLLVLDNLEHVLDAAPQIRELVLNAPSVKAIFSSRAPLRVSGEQEYPVPELADDDAVALFSERAHGDQAGFPAERRRTDRRRDLPPPRRAPAAIELAAARAKVLSPPALLERLDQRLPVLTGGARDVPDRQRTLRDTIAWSYELLDVTEQRLFARLAVFVGRVHARRAEQVCDADLDTLTSLVEKSLVRQDDDRFRMLETIREFALERLEESGELEADQTPPLRATSSRSRSERETQTSSVRLVWRSSVLDSEHDNFRAAFKLRAGAR